MNKSLKAFKAYAAYGAILSLAACGGNDTPLTAETFGAAAPAAVASSGGSNVLPERPASSGSVREVYRVDSLRSLVDQSDLVIVGRATAVAPGRVVGKDIGGQLGFRDVSVQVEQVLHGTYKNPTLTLEELGWKDGQPFTINQASWANSGDTMLMGLKATTNGSTAAGPRYILTNMSTRFFLGPDGKVRDNYIDDHEKHEAGAYVAEATALDAGSLTRQVQSAG
jgi:hypothetical protein